MTVHGPSDGKYRRPDNNPSQAIETSDAGSIASGRNGHLRVPGSGNPFSKTPWLTVKATGAALLGLVSGLTSLFLALHHPLAPWSAAALVVFSALMIFIRQNAWLITLPAFLPIVAFAPWTGWITFEELDLLVLAVAAGGYARLALPRSHASATNHFHSRRSASVSKLVGLAVTLFAASVLAAMVRGFNDSGGLEFGWYQGYREPLNSLRLAKPFFMALLLWPLWRAASTTASKKSGNGLSVGLVIGLGLASLAAVWERTAFTGLLDFSSDYRTTALFWEMQVGGAAFDGFLALTVPFCALALLTARGRWGLAMTASVSMLAAYACLTTFSRGVYLAVPIGVGVTTWLAASQGADHNESGTEHLAGHLGRTHFWTRIALILGFTAAAATMFPTSGYRGLLAVLGAALLLLPLASALTGCSVRGWVMGLGIGAVLSSFTVLGASWLSKGTYVMYGLATLTTFAILARYRLPGHVSADGRSQVSSRVKAGTVVAATAALAGFVVVVTNVSLVALHWGGGPAFNDTLPVVVAFVAVMFASSRFRALSWPSDLRWQGTTFGAMALVGISIAVFSGGAYMGGRFSTSQADMSTRTAHWRKSLELLKTPEELLLGKGLGRFSSALAGAAQHGERSSDYRLLSEAGNGYLALSGGSHMMGWGEMLRVSQRVDVPQGNTTVRFDVRAAQTVALHFEVCEKHLLYSAGCVIGALPVKALPGQWQTLQLPLSSGTLSRGLWFAPRLLAFSIGIQSNDRRVEVDNLSLTDASGRNLLGNGDFSDGMAQWFFTSDSNHLPWHEQNLGIHVLIQQGLVGLTLLCMLAAGAVWRLSFGRAKDHPLAPAIAGALIAFLVVGAFDSLLNVPRVAFLFYFFVLVGLTLRGPRMDSPRGFFPTPMAAPVSDQAQSR